MGIEGRVERLEKWATPSGVCTCGGGERVIYEPDWHDPPHDPGPEVCPTCGLRRLTFRVIYGDPGQAKTEQAGGER